MALCSRGILDMESRKLEIKVENPFRRKEDMSILDVLKKVDNAFDDKLIDCLDRISVDKRLQTIELRKLVKETIEGSEGHWGFLKYDEACCSKCGHVISLPFYSTNEAREKWGELPKYCEECGTKMDLTVRSGFPKLKKK